MTREVFRIERWTTQEGCYWLDCVRHDWKAWTLPSPCTPGEEAILDFLESEDDCEAIFAFLSLADIVNWFTVSQLHCLHRDGFHVAVYAVSRKHAAFSQTQTVFHRELAAFKRNVPLTAVAVVPASECRSDTVVAA